MKAKTVKLGRYAPMYGWRNRLLRVDLSTGRIWAQETAPYLPDFLGARGLAAKIVWDEYPEPVEALDPRNPLMVMPGALTGTRAPYSGRTNVCAFSPQGHPYPWFTRASIGADWGAELKKAGYDGLVVTGASETPVHLIIRDDEVTLLPAEELWGLDTYAAQEAACAVAGQGCKTLTIGPAGERLSRIATIQTATTSVAGQGGFGAVMGSKKLKAISVIGSQQVPVADPERLQWLFRAVGEEVRTWKTRPGWVEQFQAQLDQEGGGKVRAYPCTASCPSPCSLYLSGVEGRCRRQKYYGGLACVSHLFKGQGCPGLYDWELGLRGGFELNVYANQLGLNHWDLLVGIVPWLRTCQREGLLQRYHGREIDWNSPEFWTEFLRTIAYREGLGDGLAEGGWRAAQVLGLGEEVVRRYYTGWGYAGHWDGHAAFVNHIIYPFWIVSVLHWAMDTRDPASSTHDYIQGVSFWGPLGFRGQRPEAPITWEHLRGVGQILYGDASTMDVRSHYEGKALPAAYHAVRAIMKDCLPTDDQVFPLMFSPNTEDRFCRIAGIPGPDVDAHILRAGTGLDWDTRAFEHAAERALNLERALMVRHWGRDRQMDERVLPSFEYDENWVNPELGQRQRLDRGRFAAVMDEYLRLRGWDVATGWPTRERLVSLDLGDVYEPMVAGARAAQARLPKLPPVPPVHDYHQYDPDRVAPAEARK